MLTKKLDKLDNKLESVLSAQEILFCSLYVQGFDPKGAYAKAGFDNKNRGVYALLDRKDIQDCIREKVHKVAKDISGNFSLEEWIENLKTVRDRTLGKPKPVMIMGPEGKLVNLVEDSLVRCPECSAEHYVPAAMYLFDSNGANKVLELMGKYKKWLTDKIEISSELTPEMLGRLDDTEKEHLFILLQKVRGEA